MKRLESAKHLNKYLSASLVSTMNNLKEYEQTHRKVLSLRDIRTDFSGIFSVTFSDSKYRQLCLYDKKNLDFFVNLGV